VTTAWLAFSRATNASALTGARRSPARKLRRGFFQDRALLAQNPVLASQAPQLLLVVARQPVAALARIHISLFEPHAQGLARHPQLTGNLGVRFPAGTRQPNRLGTKLRRGGGHMLYAWTCEHLLGGFTPKRTGVHRTGATSYLRFLSTL
jgi:hypothetical protein